ncbi:MAG: aspartate kinase [Elusimicrobia bacterium]|nr:aspartate kinase [Elusimicrobiota bacterium]
MKSKRILKLGGATLATPSQIQKAARAVKALLRRGDSLAVVVSAMGKETDRLYRLYLQCTGNKISNPDLELFLSSGEWASAQLLASALKSQGVCAQALTPWERDWPLKIRMTGQGPPLQEKTSEIRSFRLLPSSRRAIRQKLSALWKKGAVPVLCGFVGQDAQGRVVTLGRGGSDLSAFLFAEAIRAQEVLLIKDVPGVFSWDPRTPGNIRPYRISRIGERELALLASAGSRVIHPGAFKYLRAGQTARVASLNQKDLLKGGTLILKSESASLRVSKTPMAAITLVGKNLPQTPGILHALTQPLKRQGIPIHAVTVSESLLALYLPDSQCDRAYARLIGAGRKFPAIASSTVKRNLTRIEIHSPDIIEAPGILARLLQPIARKGINIWEMVTIHSEILLFVESPYVAPILSLLKKSLKKI